MIDISNSQEAWSLIRIWLHGNVGQHDERYEVCRRGSTYEILKLTPSMTGKSWSDDYRNLSVSSLVVHHPKKESGTSSKQALSSTSKPPPVSSVFIYLFGDRLAIILALILASRNPSLAWPEMYHRQQYYLEHGDKAASSDVSGLCSIATCHA